MSTHKKTIGMLRQLISEVVKMRVIAQYVDVETDATGKEVEVDSGSMIERILDEDDANDINLVLSRYGAKAPKWSKTGLQDSSYKMKKDPATGKSKRTPPTSHADENEPVREVARQLYPADPQTLITVIAPWGDEGFDALRRLYVVAERKYASFPFFEIEPAVGAVYPFPKDPTPNIIQKIAETRPNVGGKATGRGELLFALMTGGIAGGEEGDITIPDGGTWEVKDITGAKTARIGETASAAFSAALVDQNILDAMRSVKTPTVWTPTQVAKIAAAWQVAASSLAGFILVDGNQFRCVEPADLTPIYVAPNGRITVKIK